MNAAFATRLAAAMLGAGLILGTAIAAPKPLSAEEEAVRQKVVLSLKEAPYFYDGHVNVGIEKGAVVLRGYVFSDWDMRDAIRLANAAAQGKRGGNDLS